MRSPCRAAMSAMWSGRELGEGDISIILCIVKIPNITTLFMENFVFKMHF
jgi:hypothetical protein